MQKGEVIYCPSWEFPDGGKDDKLIINLNNPSPGEPYILLLTTSQQKKKTNAPGCRALLGYHVIPKKVDFFDRDFTWVLFWTVTEFSLEKELRESWRGNFITKGILKPETVSAIINCFKASNYATQRLIDLLK